MGVLAYWRENLKRTFRSEGNRQSLAAIAALIIGALGYGQLAGRPDVQQLAAVVGLVYVFMLLLIVTPQRMWNQSQASIHDYRERQQPRLHFVFDSNRLPYLQEHLIRNKDESVNLLRIYRIGIRNDSAVVVPNVRVVLESIEAVVEGKLVSPLLETPILFEHALSVMGLDDKAGRVDVAPGDTPTAFVDVVAQQLDSDGNEGDWMSPCYASGHRPILLSRGLYVFGLRVEGGGTFARSRFAIGATLDDRKIKMALFTPSPSQGA